MVIVVFVVILVVVFVVITVVAMMLGMFAMELTAAHILPMNPFVMVFRPMPGNPEPFVAIVPVACTIGVIRPIAQVDRDPDRHGVWPHKQANRQESHCKTRKFCFHSRYKLFV